MTGLIGSIMNALDVDAEVAQKAVGIMLQFVRDNGSAADVQKLFEALPGAEQAMVAAGECPSNSDSGFLDILFGGIGIDPRLMAVVRRLETLGLDLEQSQAVAVQLFDYFKAHSDPDLIARVKNGIPALKTLI